MASVNKVILIGNLGRDPETRYMPDGGAVTNVSIATTESWKDKNGEKQEKTEWHRVAFFGKLAEIAGEYLKKGSQVYVEGRLQTRKWQDKDGQDKYTTEIIADRMQMLGSRQGMGGGDREAGGEREGGSRPAAKPAGAGAGAGAGAKPAGAGTAIVVPAARRPGRRRLTCRGLHPSNREKQLPKERDGLSAHILPTSSTLVGACMTVISVVKLMHPGGVGVVIDKLLALGTVLFLASALLSFVSMRIPQLESRLEGFAEILFLVALAVAGVAAVVLSFQIS